MIGPVASSLGQRSGQSRVVGYIGDSIVKGDGVVPFPTQTEALFARPSRRFINQGQNARQLSTITPTEIMVRDPNVSVIAAGTNDLAISSATLAELQGWISALAASVLGYGVRVVVGTILASVNLVGANELTRLAYNAWLVGGGVAGVRVSDPSAAPQLQNPLDLTYFSDGVHPTTAGAAVMATYYQAAESGL